MSFVRGARPLMRTAAQLRSSSTPLKTAQPVRGFGGGGGRTFDGPYGGLHLHRPATLNSRVAKVFGTTMWLWILYRGYHDLGHMFGLHHPWEHPGHEHVDLNDEDDVFLAELKA